VHRVQFLLLLPCSFWRDEYVEEFANQVAAPGAPKIPGVPGSGFSTLQQCLNACDNDVK
jgi:hypothetical protein